MMTRRRNFATGHAQNSKPLLHFRLFLSFLRIPTRKKMKIKIKMKNLKVLMMRRRRRRRRTAFATTRRRNKPKQRVAECDDVMGERLRTTVDPCLEDHGGQMDDPGGLFFMPKP
jgi:hypothetical protein